MPARPLEEARETMIISKRMLLLLVGLAALESLWDGRSAHSSGLALIVLFLVVNLRQKFCGPPSSGHAAELAVSACCQQVLERVPTLSRQMVQFVAMKP